MERAVNLYNYCGLIVIVALLSMPMAEAAESMVVVTEGNHAEAYVHPHIPMTVKVPDVIDDVALGVQSYGITRRNKSIQVLAPPEPPETLLVIYTVSGQQFKVMLRSAASVDLAVSEVAFVRKTTAPTAPNEPQHEARTDELATQPRLNPQMTNASEPTQRDIATDSLNAVSKAEIAPASTENESQAQRQWAITVGTAIGRSRTNESGIRSKSFVTVVGACGTREMMPMLYIGICADQFLPRRPTVAPGECEEDHCRTLHSRNLYATSIVGLAGIRFGSRFVWDLQAQAGGLFRYSRSGSILHFSGARMDPISAVKEKMNHRNASPFVAGEVGIGYPFANHWRIGLSAKISSNIPVSEVLYQVADTQLYLHRDVM